MYIWVLFILYLVYISKNQEQRALGYIIIVLIALKIEWYDFSLYMHFYTLD